jgi:hypothetical protein
LASGYRAEECQHGNHSLSFIAKGPINTIAPSRILLPARPKHISMDNTDITAEVVWDEKSHTALLTLNNSPDGHNISIEW